MSFEDKTPNVKANLLPAHGNTSVNMVDGCPGKFRVFDVRVSVDLWWKCIELYVWLEIANMTMMVMPFAV